MKRKEVLFIGIAALLSLFACDSIAINADSTISDMDKVGH